MAQDFRVLRCCECKIFQVHQVKKSNKWNCKVCGTKQSVRQVYGKGAAADCRRHVQKLNALRGMQALEQDVQFGQLASENLEDVQRNILNEPVLPSNESSTSSKGSKWSNFLQGENEYNESTDGDLKEDCQAFTHISPPEARKPHPVFRCGMGSTGISCPDISQKEKKQQFRHSFLQETAVKQSENSVKSADPVNEMSLGAKPSGFTSIREKSKWSHFVKTSDSKKCDSKDDTAEKHSKPVCSKTSKWSHFIQTSKSNASEEEDNCRKTCLNDISDIQNVKNTKPAEGNYKGFQFILKASSQSESTEFSTDF